MTAANTTTERSTQITSAVTVASNTDYVLTLSSNIFSSNGSINIPSSAMEHSVIIFKAVKPSVVISTWLKYVKINGTTASNGSNCQVKMYNKGAIIMPYSSSTKPLTCYSGTDFTGTSSTNYVTGSNGGYMRTLTTAQLNNNIKSFKLKRGYMVTFATGTAGWGYSRCFVADTEDLEMNLPAVLAGKASSYRLFQWYNFGKTGLGADVDATHCDVLNVQGCYTWNAGEGGRMPDTEWLSHKIHPWWPGVDACGANEYSCTMKTDNEPANSADDQPATVDQVLGYWEDAMRTGMRLCSPSTYDGGNNGAWFAEFFNAIDSRGWRCDIYDIHCYWANFGGLWNYYNAYKRPLLISEWIWGASWNSNGAFASGVTDSQIISNTTNILNTLNSTDYVERYFYWNHESKAHLYDSDGITELGKVYAATDGGLGYNKSLEYIPKVVMRKPYSLEGTASGNVISLTWNDKNGDMMDEIQVQYLAPNATSWTTLATITRKDKSGSGDQSYSYSGTLENAANCTWRVVDTFDGTDYSSDALSFSEPTLIDDSKFIPANLNDYYFQFYSKEASADIVWAVYDSNSSENRVYYKAHNSNYGTDLYQLWLLESNSNGGYSLRNAGELGYYICSPNSWNFTTRDNDYTTAGAKTAFDLTYMNDGDYWIMKNVAHGMYVGLWDNDKNFAAGEVLAGNRTNPTGTDSGDKLGIRLIPKSVVNENLGIVTISSGTYYLYNPSAGLFISAGNSWDTQAIASQTGIDFNLDLGTTGYTLDSNISNGGNNHYLGSGLYTDAALFEWTFAEAGNIDGHQAYTISNGTNYLACPSTENTAITTTTNVNAASAKWILLTRKDLIDRLASATENNPMDATFFIPGSRFSRNDGRLADWNGGPVRNGYSGTEWGDFNGEKFDTTFDVYQLITDAPDGIYEVSMQGFYRDGGYDAAAALRTAGNEVINAYLYANDQTLALPSIFSEAGNCGTQGVNQSTYGYIPNGQVDVSYYIHNGLYATGPLRFNVEGGSLRVGVKKTVAVEADWTIFDNFKLIYLGTGEQETPPYWIALEQCQQAAQDNESSIAGAAQAALDEYEWTSDEYAGKTATEITEAIKVLDNATTISNASQVTTSLVKNIDFSEGYSGSSSGSRVQTPNDWTLDYSMGGWLDTFVDATNHVFNAWAGVITYCDMYQTLTNLPQGTYKITAECGTDVDNGTSKVGVYAKSGSNYSRSEEVIKLNDAANRDFEEYACYVEVGEDHQLTFGIRSDGHYYQVRNFTITFVPDNEAQTDASYLRYDYFNNEGYDAYEFDATGSEYANAQDVLIYPLVPNQIIKAATTTQFVNTNNKVVNGTCANFVITDGSGLQITNATGAFTATNATYSRIMGEEIEWGTVILPYSVASDENVQFYEFIYDQTIQGTWNLCFKAIDNVPANTPVVFRKLTEGATSVTMNGSGNVLLTTDTQPANFGILSLAGLYEQEVMTDGLDNIYYVAQDKFWAADGLENGLTIPAFRAYMTMASNVKSLNILVIDDDATGIMSVDAQSGMTICLPANIYNLAGQLVKAKANSLDALAPGIYIVNGKKYIKQ